MSGEAVEAGPKSLGDYVSILWRHRVVLLVAVVGVPAVAVLLSSFRPAEYTASADVLVRTENLAATLSGIPDATSGGDPVRLLDTQARLARTPGVATGAIRASHVEISSSDFLDSSAVEADPSADILRFTVTASTPARATLLANAYAAAYARYRTALEIGPVEQATRTVNARLNQLKASGNTGRPIYETLLERQQELESIRALRSQSAVLVDPATTAPKTQPRPMFAALIGLIAGLLLGIAAALGREALQNRPRSVDEIKEQLGLRVLGRLPETSVGRTELVTLDRPESLDAEAYRLLRANFDAAASRFGGKVFAVASLVEGEGKSTVAANLAVALARVGHDVIIIDCDTLRPVLATRFRLPPSRGGLEAATNPADLSTALQPVSLVALGRGGDVRNHRVGASAVSVHRTLSDQSNRERAKSSEKHGNMSSPESNGRVSRLRVLPATPVSAEESNYFMATMLASVLDSARAEADIVIVDTPPLTTSVGVGVARLMDGLVIVANMSMMRRPMVKQLASQLRDMTTPGLGLVLTGVPPDPTVASYGYYGAVQPSDDRLQSADRIVRYPASSGS